MKPGASIFGFVLPYQLQDNALVCYLNNFLGLLTENQTLTTFGPVTISEPTRAVLVIPTTLILGVVTLLLAYFAYYVHTHWTRTARIVNKFPGPSMLPFIGNYEYLMCASKDWQQSLTNLFTKYGECYRLWIFHKPVICVADGKVAEKVLAGYDNIEKDDPYVAFKRLLGNGLVTGPGEKWRRDRKMLNPAFGYKHFEGFMKIFNEQSRTLVSILKKTFTTGEEQVVLITHIARATMDSVYQTVLGTDGEVQVKPEQLYAERTYRTGLVAGFRLVHCSREKMLRPWWTWLGTWHWFGLGKEEDRLINSLMVDLGRAVTAKTVEKKNTGVVTGTHTKPFIAFILDEVKNEEDIAYQVNTLCATGSETTASALNYLLFLLALNPDCQEKIKEEIDSVFTDDPTRDLTMADLSDLKYMEMCIKEGLRLYPSVPGWFRKLSKDVQLDDGRILPEGSQVAMLAYDIHRNPEVFPDPERFDPERFNPENRIKIGPSDWIPFSMGPRNCIGHRYAIMQMKTMVTFLLRNFTLHTQNRREDLKVAYGIVAEPFPEIKMTLEPLVPDCDSL